jgi:ribonuclease D
MRRPEWIDDARALAEVARGWHGRCVGFDSEFIRVRTFYPEAALYQGAVGGSAVLIDPLPLSAEDQQPLADALASPDVNLVMHACSEDLELLRRHLGIVPARLFDTQVAGSFVFPEPGLGYQALVRRLLDIEIDKSETRSDWRRRPLSQSQLDYAVVDVLHLEPMQDLLLRRLEALGRRAWVEEEMAQLLAASALQRPLDEYYLGVRDAWRLGAKARTVLRDLCAWREATARTRDRPRSRIVPDALLVEIARRGVRRRQELEALLVPPLSARWAPELEALIEAALAPDTPPAAPVPPPLAQEHGELVKALREPVVALAASLQLSEGLLASRRLLELLLRARVAGEPVPAEWRGWRAEVVRPVLDPILDQARWRLGKVSS